MTSQDHLKVLSNKNNITKFYLIQLFFKLVVIPQTYVEPKLYTSDSSSPKTVESAIVEVKYLDVLKQFAIHFWYRRDLLNPIAADLNGVRTTTQAVAGATEKETYTNAGDEALSVLYRPHSDG